MGLVTGKIRIFSRLNYPASGLNAAHCYPPEAPVLPVFAIAWCSEMRLHDPLAPVGASAFLAAAYAFGLHQWAAYRLLTSVLIGVSAIASARLR